MNCRARIQTFSGSGWAHPDDPVNGKPDSGKITLAALGGSGFAFDIYLSQEKSLLYANPNDGVFDVSIKFAEESFIVLSVWNTLTVKKVFQTQNTGKNAYLQHIDAAPLSAGAYSLRLDHSRGTKFIRFMVK
ncbi:MAG TPA: hypothetical protein VFO54_00625 [Chryseosolibacter sp.]|nr:hypothetical protein [Chryseosolibacter sp.]